VDECKPLPSGCPPDRVMALKGLGGRYVSPVNTRWELADAAVNGGDVVVGTDG
jgi:hypothetical protein